MSKEQQEKYDAIFNLLADAELAARNGHWMTCGSFCKKAMDKAFEFGKQETKGESK